MESKLLNGQWQTSQSLPSKSHIIHIGEVMFLISPLQPASLVTGTYNGIHINGSRLWH